MKTVLYGKVTAQHLADAALFSGIEPTTFITNGVTKPPRSALPLQVIPPDPMSGDSSQQQNHWRMAIQGDALVCVGVNEHLVRVAGLHGLLIYEAET